MEELGGANRDILKRQLQILRKAPEQRSPEDVRAFAASLSKTKFFQDLGNQEKIKVCQYLKLEGAPKDTTLFKQGDQGDKFYLILCGSVGVFIKDVEAKDVEASKAEAPEPSDASSPTPEAPAPHAAAKEPSGGWVKLAKLVHGAVPPTVAELQLEGALMDAPEVPPESPTGGTGTAPAGPAGEVPVEDVELPEEEVPGKPEISVMSSPSRGPSPQPSAPSAPVSPRQLTIDEGEGSLHTGPSERFKLQVQRSESRLSSKSIGSEHSDGAGDGRTSPALVREPSLLSQIKSIGAIAKKEKEEEADAKKSTGSKSIMRAILSRPLFSLRGPKLIEVAQLQVGDSFGEVALQTDQPRAATVKSRSDAIFATLLREDYKAILHSQLAKLQQERQTFLRSIPLLEHLPNIPNLAALLQSRSFCHHGILINLGAPVMHMYLVSSGTFSIRGRIKLKVMKEERPSKVPRPEEGRRRPSDLKALERTEEKAAKTEKKIPVSPTIVSLILPGSTYGLSHFLKGDREHLRQVLCESSSGFVYTLFAKDVAAHLSQKERSQVIAMALAEEAFFKQRCMAVGQLHAASSSGKKRVWPPEKTLLDKIREFRDVLSAKSIYSPEGRLRAIGSAFLEESKHQETQLHLEKVQAAKQTVNSSAHEEKPMTSIVTDAPGVEPFREPVLQSGWRMQDLAHNVFHACHDTSNPGALAADLRAAVEKDVRLARRSKHGTLAPIAQRPWNPLEEGPGSAMAEVDTPRKGSRDVVVPRLRNPELGSVGPLASLQNSQHLSVVPSEDSGDFEVSEPSGIASPVASKMEDLTQMFGSECSKSIAEECTSGLPGDFFSSRLLQLQPGSFSPTLLLALPPSRCSTGVPQSRGTVGSRDLWSRGSRGSRGSMNDSPWQDSVQLDQVFTAKSSRYDSIHSSRCSYH